MPEDNNYRRPLPPRGTPQPIVRRQTPSVFSGSRPVPPPTAPEPQAIPQPPAPEVVPPTQPEIPVDPFAQQLPAPDPQTTAPVMNFEPPKSMVKKRLPIGVYFIAVWLISNFLYNVVLPTPLGVIGIVIGIISLLLGIGLLLRKELARKGLVIMLAVLIAQSFVVIALLLSLQQQVKTDKANYTVATQKLTSGEQLSSDQKNDLSNAQTEINDKQKQIGKSPNATYAINVLGIFVCASIIVYLRRPKVKSALKSQ